MLGGSSVEEVRHSEVRIFLDAQLPSLLRHIEETLPVVRGGNMKGARHVSHQDYVDELITRALQAHVKEKPSVQCVQGFISSHTVTSPRRRTLPFLDGRNRYANVVDIRCVPVQSTSRNQYNASA